MVFAAENTEKLRKITSSLLLISQNKIPILRIEYASYARRLFDGLDMAA